MIIDIFLLSNRWLHFMPQWFDQFMWIVYLICLNDSILLLYKFLHPKYHILIEFNTIRLKLPIGYKSDKQRNYFKMDMRKKIGTYSIIGLIIYSLYIDSLVLLCFCVIIPILLHIIVFRMK